MSLFFLNFMSIYDSKFLKNFGLLGLIYEN